MWAKASCAEFELGFSDWDTISRHCRPIMQRCSTNAERVPSKGNSFMKTLVPRHINDVESDRRAVKNGWYAINETGELRSGPFSNRPECVEYIGFKNSQAADRRKAAIPSGSIPYWMQQFPI
jgi:hypothetical protein